MLVLPNPFLSAAPQVAAGTAAASLQTPASDPAATYPRGFDPERFIDAIVPRRDAR